MPGQDGPALAGGVLIGGLRDAASGPHAGPGVVSGPLVHVLILVTHAVIDTFVVEVVVFLKLLV